MSSKRLRTRAAAAVLVIAAAGACGGDGVDETVSFESHDYAFTGVQVDAKAGDKVAFVMKNTGPGAHEFEVFDPDGEVLGEIEPITVGKTGKLTLTLTKPGTYRFVCGVEDHEARGMTGTFRIS